MSRGQPQSEFPRRGAEEEADTASQPNKGRGNRRQSAYGGTTTACGPAGPADAAPAVEVIKKPKGPAFTPTPHPSGLNRRERDRRRWIESRSAQGNVITWALLFTV